MLPYWGNASMHIVISSEISYITSTLFKDGAAMARKAPDPMSKAVSSINKMNSLASEVADLAIEFSNKVVELERGLLETKLLLREAQLANARNDGNKSESKQR